MHPKVCKPKGRSHSWPGFLTRLTHKKLAQAYVIFSESQPNTSLSSMSKTIQRGESYPYGSRANRRSAARSVQDYAGKPSEGPPSLSNDQ
jgi:hypothetical protein